MLEGLRLKYPPRGLRFFVRTAGSNSTRRPLPVRDSVKRGLEWLERHQSDDGSWNARDYDAGCGKCLPHGVDDRVDAVRSDFSVGLTGLAVMALTAAGRTCREDDALRRALADLIRRQDGEGCIGSRECDKFMYNHLVATAALCEAYALTGSNRLKLPAQRAVDFVMAAQNPGAGWRYIEQAGENDTLVTGWAIVALHSAARAALDFDRAAAYDGSRAWLDKASYRVADDAWRTGYQFPGTGCPILPDIENRFDPHPTPTAAGAAIRLLMGGRRDDPKIAGAMRSLAEDPPASGAVAVDFYYWHWAALAIHLFGAEDARWSRVDELIESSQSAGGSWPPADRWSRLGGRVYATAMATLTLQTGRRYAQD